MANLACPHCGAANDPDAAFCGECGRSLPPRRGDFPPPLGPEFELPSSTPMTRRSGPLPPGVSFLGSSFLLPAVAVASVLVVLLVYALAPGRRASPVDAAPAPIAQPIAPVGQPSVPSAPPLGPASPSVTPPVGSGDSPVIVTVPRSTSGSSTTRPDGRSVPLPLAPNSPLGPYVQQQVGDYLLDKAERDDDELLKGSVDAVVLHYVAPDGGRVQHVLAAWPSAESAAQALRKGVEEESGGWKVTRQEELQDRQGQRLGPRYVLRDGSGREAVGWCNTTLLLVAEGPEGRLADFYQNLPY